MERKTVLNVRIFFLCDGKKERCKDSEGCYWQNRGQCMHTSDPRHSRNFDPLTEEGLEEIDVSGMFDISMDPSGSITFEERTAPLPPRRVFGFDGVAYDYPARHCDLDILRDTISEQLGKWEELDDRGDE